MERYESKHVQIQRSAEMIYEVVSRFDNLTPVIGDKVEGWNASEDCCSFNVKGFNLKLKMIDKEHPKHIKVISDDGSPMDFTFWMQLVSISPTDTRMRLVLDVKLNTMMKMMIGGKIAGGIDQIAEKIAEGFNNAPI